MQKTTTSEERALLTRFHGEVPVIVIRGTATLWLTSLVCMCEWSENERDSYIARCSLLSCLWIMYSFYRDMDTSPFFSDTKRPSQFTSHKSQVTDSWVPVCPVIKISVTMVAIWLAATNLLKVGETTHYGGGALEYMTLPNKVAEKEEDYYFSAPGSSKYGDEHLGSNLMLVRWARKGGVGCRFG